MANKLPAVIQSGTNNYLTPSLSFNRVSTDLVTPGIVGLIGTGGSGATTFSGSFAINQQGSANMTVAVSSGQLYVSATPTGGTAQTLGVTSDASENVTIASNSSGSTVYDFIYLKLDPDKLNNSASTGLDVPSFLTQRSTTAGVDSNGTAANSLLLAEITVANNATSISAANITDRRVSAVTTMTSGWTLASETWTYVSATTFTVTTDLGNKYSVGDKIRLRQSASAYKYFYITAVGAFSGTTTTITVNGGTDYTLANATIYDNSYSKKVTPVGFPQWFNYTPSYTGFSANPTTPVVRFGLVGRQCIVSVATGGNGTSNANTFTIALPITAGASSSGSRSAVVGVDNSVNLTSPALAQISASGTTISFFKDFSSAVWTTSGSKNATGVIIYEV